MGLSLGFVLKTALITWGCLFLAELCLHSIKLFSALDCPNSEELRVNKKMAGNRVRTADLSRPEGHSTPRGIMLRISCSGKKKETEDFRSDGIFLSKSLLHVTEPWSPGDGEQLWWHRGSVNELESGKWVPWYSCVHNFCFPYYTVLTQIQEFYHFYPSHSPPQPDWGEWASGCVGLGCQLG